MTSWGRESNQNTFYKEFFFQLKKEKLEKWRLSWRNLWDQVLLILKDIKALLHDNGNNLRV